MAFQVGKNTVILVDKYDLTSYFNALDLGVSVDLPETTTFGNGSKRRQVVGLKDGQVAPKGLFDGAANAVDGALRAAFAAATDPLLTVDLIGAAIGNPAVLAQAIEAQYSVQAPLAGVVETMAEFKPSQDYGVEFGVSLHALAAETVSTNSTSVDNAASSANGGVAHLHVTALAGDGTQTANIVVQHSADNAVWADLVTFAQVTTATTKQRSTVAAGTTVNRYLRAKSTIALGGGGVSFTYTVAFARR